MIGQRQNNATYDFEHLAFPHTAACRGGVRTAPLEFGVAANLASIFVFGNIILFCRQKESTREGGARKVHVVGMDASIIIPIEGQETGDGAEHDRRGV